MDINKLKKRLKNLEEQLDAAIDSENYESAADIREKIDKVKKQIENANKKTDLEQQFDGLKDVENDFKSEMFFPGDELPGLGENVEIYDYEGAFDDLRIKAEKVIEILVLSIFSNDKSILEDPIIKEKMADDIDSYTDLKFMCNMARRLYMNAMKDIDNGSQNSRMYEVVSKMQSEMRQNNKMLSLLMKDMNTSYRQLKEDLAERLMSTEEDENNNVIDMKEMNNTIQQHLEELKAKRLEKRKNNRKSQAQLRKEKEDDGTYDIEDVTKLPPPKEEGDTK